MKILMVNKFHYIKGGSETYYFTLKKMLEEQGHKIIDFSMKDNRNFDSIYKDYFVENIDYQKTSGLISKIKMAINIIYSFEAKRKFEQLVLKETPDLIHLHIFQHQLSPSILDIIKKYKIPTVYTAHDLKMLCLNYKMMHHGSVCEKCKNGKYYNCLINKCIKESFAKSMINTIEGYFHQFRSSYDAIETIVTPSEFYRKKFIEFGIDENRVVHIPNFLEQSKPVINIKKDNKKYCLYFGRLSEEKGVITLLKAAKKAGVLTYIVGTGPLKEEIEEYIVRENLQNIKLLGFMSGQELLDVVGNARVVVLPSEWYENGPYSAIEALQLSRPIIGANIGGIPELIEDNGYLFEPGNYEQLGDILKKMENIDIATYQQLEEASYKLFLKNHVPEVHMARIKKVYERLGLNI